MIVVVSETRTKPGEQHAPAYTARNEEFGRFLRDHPRFRGRRLVRSVDDPRECLEIAIDEPDPSGP